MIAILILLLLAIGLPAAAAPGGWAPPPPPPALAAGLEATADHLEGALAAGRLTFTGHVEITSGSQRLRAERVVLTLETAHRRVRRVEATGSVQLVYGVYTATADHAVFDTAAGRSLLTGGAKIWGGGREVEGERIEIDLTHRTVAVTKGRLLVPAHGTTPAVRVVAASIEADDLHGIARLRGDVEVVNGTRHLWGDEITIHTVPKSSTVRRIDARGHVRVVDGDRRGEADAAHYDLTQHRLTLVGSARLEEGGNRIRGARIRLDLETRQVEVEHGTIHYRPE